MEVVLSPGRFGDEAAGAPFQNEEIREWSHVDRLTGMLERARVETGRWQTSNQGAARSYGKVIDSRERNSADGSVVQRARRQVEVFQSQGPGRSVQVVRASQWSSSRVTDSTIAGPQALTSAQKEEKPADRFASLCRLSPPGSSLCREEAISERLSSLLGSFTYPASSTVPLRRIDSKYASRTPISLTSSKRFSSNENLSTNEETRANLFAAKKSLRESRSQNGNREIDSTTLAQKDFSQRAKELPRKNPEDSPNVRIHGITVEREESRNFFAQEIKDKASEKNFGEEKNSFEETRAAASKSAIHLLPSSKANTTVVNIMNSSDSQPWLANASQIGNESRKSETTTGETTRGKNEEFSPMPISTGRVKRVGFCKTEIHFAADSGKVNIVETDGKPPPTNKFRRRKRNGPCNKIAPIANLPDVNYNETNGKNITLADDSSEDKTKNDPNLHRGHTTTVNLGTDFLVKNERAERVIEETSQIVELQDKEISASSSLPSTNPTGSSSKPEINEDYNVLCTDAENNKVLLKVVTTHEPTIARVESDHLRKKILNNVSPPTGSKKEHRSSSKAAKPEIQKKEHTYVNIFTGSKRAPIYENYKISETSAKEKIKISPAKTEAKSSEKKYSDAKNPNFGSVKKSKEQVENTKVDKIKSDVNGKTVVNNQVEDRSNGSEKIRNSKTKNMKISSKNKLARTEVICANSTNSGAPRVRSSSNNIGKISGSKRSSVQSQEESFSSSERGLRTSGGSSTVNKSNGSKSTRENNISTRDVVASVKAMKKNGVSTRQKPMEVVYQTAVYNMKNERLSRPQKGKESSKGPRYLNELICGAKTKRASESKSKTSSTSQNAADKGASQTVRHWK